MPTNWNHPFSRYAYAITDEEGRLIWGRPASDAHKPIPDPEYQELERIRVSWLESKRRALEANQEAYESEEHIRQMRLLVRDGRERAARKTLKKLSEWQPWKDAERWEQLERWLDRHPQRSHPDDIIFERLDDDTQWVSPFEVEPEVKTHSGRGRKRGYKATSEQRERLSKSMKRAWAIKRQQGEEWKQPIQKRDSPY